MNINNYLTFVEFLKLLLRFTSVYANDMRKGENAKQMLPSLLQYSKLKIPNASPTTFLFLLQIWVQLRDSEAPFFVESLEAFKEVCCFLSLTTFSTTNFCV